MELSNMVSILKQMFKSLSADEQQSLCKVLNYVKILIQDRITTSLLQQIS